ncbi:MAG TPA: hypothetical protein VGZ48_14570 [Candidatus Acidoferrales bacterium]|jgi:hypothetical protein|nr:hypothetical protein [Candidatus Acidoferrales bacterium]
MTESCLAGKIQTTSIIKLLEIECRWVLPSERASLLLAERPWEAEGRPTAPHELTRLLERVLRLCVAEGMLYAPVLLLRKKSLQRGTWLPKAQPIGMQLTTRPGALPTSEGRATETLGGEADDCPRCSGTGLYTSPDGRTGYLCPCGSYLRNLKLQKQSAQIDAKT